MTGCELSVRRELLPGLLTGQDGLAKLVEAAVNRLLEALVGEALGADRHNPGALIHCPPPNTFNFTNAPASVAMTSPVTSIRTIVSHAVFFASLNASSRLRSSLMSRAASGPSSPTSDSAWRAPRSAARSSIASNSS